MKILLFDVDGVLVDTEALHEEATSEAAGRAIDCSGGGSTQQKLRRAGIPPEEIDRIYQHKRRIYAELVDSVTPNEELLKVLRIAVRRTCMAACSNSSRESCHKLLARAGLRPFFSTVITGGDVPALKPAPDIYLEAMRQLAAQPVRCVAFEDSEEGTEAAAAAGIPSIVRCTTQSLIQEVESWLS